MGEYMKRHKKKQAKAQRPSVQQHARIVTYPQVTRWPMCEADLRTPESIRFRQESPYGAERVRRLAVRGVGEMGCGNLASYTIEGVWFCRKHAGCVLLDMLAEPPIFDLPSAGGSDQ